MNKPFDDINDTLRKEGPEGVRARHDQARKYKPKLNGNAGDHVNSEPRPPEFSDETLALRFAERHAGRLRYVAVWSRWMLWTGTQWKPDETRLAFNLAREICREAASQCGLKKLAPQLASAKTRAAVISLANDDRRLAAASDQWDADVDLLNTKEQES
jgi:putative DNA primase/helicase